MYLINYLIFHRVFQRMKCINEWRLTNHDNGIYLNNKSILMDYTMYYCINETIIMIIFMF